MDRTQRRESVSLCRLAHSFSTTALGLLFLPVLGALIGCEPDKEPQAGSAASSGARSHVLRCYTDEYGKTKQGAAPKIDDQERKAADELLAKYGGDTRRACGAVITALSGPLCNMPVALASVVACERAHAKANLVPYVDQEKKSEIQRRVNDPDPERQNTGTFSY